MPIVHLDDAVLIVSKPAGMAVTRAPGERVDPRFPTVFEAARRWSERTARERGSRATRYRIVCAPEEAAGGLVVFVADEHAQSVVEAFHTGEAERVAVALVRGILPAEREAETSGSGIASGTINAELIKVREGIRTVTPKDKPIADRRDAVTHYRVRRRSGNLALVSLRLETDWRGQVAAHMEHVGCTLLGDEPQMSRGRVVGPPRRRMLHLSEIAFTHPLTKSRERYRVPTPALFERMLEEAAERRGDRRDTPAPRVEPRVEPAAPAVQPAPAEQLDSDRDSRLSNEHAVSDSRSADLTDKQASQTAGSRADDASWEHVAEWYDTALGSKGSDHHRDVVIPGTLGLLEPRAGQTLLDIACGQGVLSRAVAEQGARVLGVDASRSLLEAARTHSESDPKTRDLVRYEQGDARSLTEIVGRVGLDQVDSAACVLAAMNIDPLEPMLRGVAGLLRAGGRFVLVILHPSFRIPKHSSWRWDEEGGRVTQSRVVETYLSEERIPITMNPGAASSGETASLTWTHHRPLGVYVRGLADAGLMVDRVEEWTSVRESEPGPRADAENRARKEIPMFMAIRAVKPSAWGG